MRPWRAVGAALSCAVAGAGGCTKAPASDSSATVASGPVAARTKGAPAAGPQCPRTGHWGECQIRIRLEQSGLAPLVTKDKVGDLPTLTGPPILFVIGNAGLAIYLYPDTVRRHSAGASLDTARFIPPSRPVGIHGEATAIQSDNALVLLFTRNEHQRERVADAITAGPPQP